MDSQTLEKSKGKPKEMKRARVRPFFGRKLPRWFRQFLAEFFATFILVFIGDSASGGFELSGKPDLHAVAVAWGVAVMIGMAMTMNISGAHMNPAVTVSLASIGKFPLRRIPHYFAGQYLGAFVGALAVFVLYYPSIEHFDGGTRVAWNSTKATGGFFSTYPRTFLGVWTPFVDQVLCTAALLVGVTTLTHPRAKLPEPLHPFIVGLLVTGMVTAFGYQCGATLNPARDLAPRLLTYLAGYKDSFEPSNYTYWFSAGLIGPHIGGIIGAWLVLIFVHDDDDDDDEQDEQDERAKQISQTKVKQSTEPKTTAAMAKASVLITIPSTPATP